MEEHSQNFDVTLGAGPGVGAVPKDPKSILYKHGHVEYQIKGNVCPSGEKNIQGLGAIFGLFWTFLDIIMRYFEVFSI